MGRLRGRRRLGAARVRSSRRDLDLVVDSDVPLGAGLSSSAALECAVAAAWSDLFGTGLDADRARQDLPAGRERVRRRTHRSDGPDGRHARPCEPRSFPRHPVAGGRARTVSSWRRRGLALSVIDTKAPHRHVDGEYASRRRDCEEAARLLGVPALRDTTLRDVDRLPATLLPRARHVVTENARVLEVVALLRSGADPREIGPLLTASHESLRDDFEVTVPEVDVAVDALLRAGAYGARITGGGFGGCVIGLVATDTVDTAISAVEAAYQHHGFDAPAAFTAVPSPGTRRLA